AGRAPRRDRRGFAAGMATGGGVAVAGVAALAIALLFTGNRHPVQGPSLVGPAQGGAPSSAPPTPTPTPTPTQTSSPSASTSSPSPPAAPPTRTPTPTP